MGNPRRVVGVFRDRRQAELAMAAARRKRLAVPAAGPLVEEADGVHVVLVTAGDPEHAHQLLLDYGAYKTVIS